MKKQKWESLDPDEKTDITERLKVHGGWLVRNYGQCDNQVYQSMVFVPDLNHDWKVEE